MTTRPDLRLTPEEYLRIERGAEWKSEYVDGEMFAMSGASFEHTVIVANLVGELRNALREGPCVVASADLRVATDPRRHYTYPDVVVVCDPPQFVRLHREIRPRCEVRAVSRGADARRVPARVAGSCRQPGGEWVLREWSDLRVGEVYAKVTFGIIQSSPP